MYALLDDFLSHVYNSPCCFDRSNKYKAASICGYILLKLLENSSNMSFTAEISLTFRSNVRQAFSDPSTSLYNCWICCNFFVSFILTIAAPINVHNCDNKYSSSSPNAPPSSCPDTKQTATIFREFVSNIGQHIAHLL